MLMLDYMSKAVRFIQLRFGGVKMEKPVVVKNIFCGGCTAGIGCLVTPGVPDFEMIGLMHLAAVYD